MNSEKQHERLEFLFRVVEKEIQHLQYAMDQVFSQRITPQTVQKLEQLPELALKIEGFTSRFCRLQDTLGDKLLPALLLSLGESKAPLLINLDKAEKYGWLDSSDDWLSMRSLRNQMVHEYIEDPTLFLDAIEAARAATPMLVAFSEKLKQTYTNQSSK
ncbi:MAG: hypothetical protein RI556_05245 [Hydrogenovibrio sp.]|uniref:hypothetical protein n=1 Tax=Hydrogenovibrio sp. TaxID=2065821 RepID=UPI0028709E19|nr:hypothetical protein [Hydrogenovibrio sp.]MDR9498560.1 hypothetical protein [Hydrogenovibrio sp.]